MTSPSEPPNDPAGGASAGDGATAPDLRAGVSGLQALCLVAAYHHRLAEPAQLVRALGLEGMAITDAEILLAAQKLDLKARAVSLSYAKLCRLLTPALCRLTDGRYVVVNQSRESRVFVIDPATGKRQWLAREEFEANWAGRAILVKTPLRIHDPHRRFGLLWFVPVILKYRRIFAEILAVTLVIQLFALVTPLFTQLVIDKVLTHKSIPTLDVLAIGMLIVIVFEGVLSVLQSHLLAHTSNRIDATLGARVLQHLLHLPLRYFEVRRVGDTVAHVRELDSIRQFLTGSALTVGIDVLFVFVFLAVMALYSVTLTLVVVATIALLALLTLAIRPMMRGRLEEKFDRGAENQAFLVETVTGIQTVKAMAIEPIMNRRWETLLARYVAASYRAAHLSGLAGALGQVVQRGSTLAVLWIGAYGVMRGDLTVGQLIGFQMLAGRAITPVMRLVKMWQDFQQVGLSVDRLGDIMNARPEPSVSASKASLPAIRGHVAIENLRFRYRADGPEVLRGLTLDIAPGTTVGIVGRSGSGKSTVAKLLQRLYLPESGRVLVDGIDLNQADPMWLRRQIGTVLQENLLFNGSVRENIAIHLPGVPMARIVEAAKLAGAHDFVVELPDGYDAPVGERGTALSGGQRQRIAIARALLADPRILIFDEATSALDVESERIIQGNLARICAGRTVFIIAHRLSTIRHADRILVLDRGELKEQGSHEELLAQRGIYHHLVHQQFDVIHEHRVA